MSDYKIGDIVTINARIYDIRQRIREGVTNERLHKQRRCT